MLSETRAAELAGALDEHLDGRVASDVYELTDPIQIRAVERAEGRHLEYVPGGRTAPSVFPFFFNLWRQDARFRSVAFDPDFGALACQLLDCNEVLLMEDNAVAKLPHTPELPWHQDLSYWPITEPVAVTFWIALDPVDAENGAIQMVPGSQLLGERLPVGFGDGEPLLRRERPEATETPHDPASEGYPVVTYDLAAGEAGFHDAMVWHGSTPNTTDRPRRAYVLRYLRSGTTWWGSVRMPYDDIGCPIGEPVDGRHLPVVGTR